MQKQKLLRIVCVAGFVGMLLMPALACLDIFIDGSAAGLEAPFSPEAIRERFEIIAPMTAFFAILGVGSAIALKVSGKSEREAEKAAAPCSNMAEGALKKPWIPRAVLLLAAAVFILLGVMNLGARDVLYKAIAICTECIGLG